ncbi:MAG: PhoH family protein, partial [Verrucomicrobiae bacterium]|nr:PhoH family protein [Verrucomicrobiae bacterium]
METQTLEFESPHFLHSLFAHDQKLLETLEASFNVSITTRDGWLKIVGMPDAIIQVEKVFEQLESARRKGGDITPQTFSLAVENVLQGLGGETLDAMVDIRLLGSATRKPVRPRTRTQFAYLRALREYHVVFGIGPAGTGKTFLAMAHALQQLRDREIDRIILTRPAVEAGEALGFLPGALEEKVLPYLRPLYDALYEMLEPGESQRFVERNLIEIAPLAYMRGRTLNRACVILDEAQNTSREQMLMFLTRLGSESSCIITGDPSQIDLRPAGKSGLLEAMRLLREVDGIQFIEFEKRDVVRHPVVQRIIEAYETGRELDDANRATERRSEPRRFRQKAQLPDTPATAENTFRPG